MPAGSTGKHIAMTGLPGAARRPAQTTADH
jgi:hypothetical protein